MFYFRHKAAWVRTLLPIEIVADARLGKRRTGNAFVHCLTLWLEAYGLQPRRLMCLPYVYPVSAGSLDSAANQWRCLIPSEPGENRRS